MCFAGEHYWCYDWNGNCSGEDEKGIGKCTRNKNEIFLPENPVGLENESCLLQQPKKGTIVNTASMAGIMTGSSDEESDMV